MRTLFFMALIVALGLYLSQREGFEDGLFAAVKRAWNNEEVKLEVGIPQNLILHKDHASLALPVVLRLTNNTSKLAALTAAPCKMFRYVITRGNNIFVQASGARQCTEEQNSGRALEAGRVLEELQTIQLATTRLAPDDYILRLRFWGYDAEKNFTITEAN